ncbi:flagellar biosynthesis protein FlaG [Candidatus Poribacteria bacterium]|nr:flagellar biosynthesis protein FlaG [Candidatus Poribacteria bacterium]
MPDTKTSFNDDAQSPKSPQLQEEAQSSQARDSLENEIKSFAEESEKIDLSNSRISFSEDQDTGATVIKIIDNKTDEVIKQIPPEEILKLRKRIGEMLGLLLDKKV